MLIEAAPAPAQTMTMTAQLLDEARQLIADPAHWTRGTYARTRGGIATLPELYDADQFCAVGAIRRVGMGRRSRTLVGQAARALGRACDEQHPAMAVHVVNDELGHYEVLRMYDLAITKENSC